MGNLRIKASAFDIEIVLQRQVDGLLKGQFKHTLGSG
jgi:hypothetical protein